MNTEIPSNSVSAESPPSPQERRPEPNAGAAAQSIPPRQFRLPALFRRLDWRVYCVLVLALIVIPVWRATTGHAKPGTIAMHTPKVAVTKVTRENLSQEWPGYAELRPYQEVDLHAKVAGYLESINVDIGDRVKAGQLLATIEVPELADDIQRANATLNRNQQEVARAQAAYEEAHLVYTRLAAVDKAQPNLIAQQDLDAAVEKDRSADSALAAAKAEVDVSRAEIAKLETMRKYCHIVAPFSGVITRRYADPGALIQAGISSSTQTLPLVRLSQNNRLRLDIPVSVSYVSRIEVGDPVDIRVDSSEEAFTGTVARSTRKVDTATRTMDVEVDVRNDSLKLIPGMYAYVSLRINHRDKTLAVPVEAVSRQKEATVFVVNKENKIEERVIEVGLETPDKLEVLSGLTENELVMIGSRTQIKPGEVVEPKPIQQAKFAE